MKKDYRKEIVKKIDELLQQASEGYCAYCNHLEELTFNPDSALEPSYVDRVQNLIKAIKVLVEQVNLLLSILFETEDKIRFQLDAIEDLKEYSKTKRVAISYRHTIETTHSFEARTYYMFYDAKTGKLEEE